ncbi:Putative Phosphotransferase [Penicillium brasilianum]|uniref:Putative Phosphotransferase n=1 Tax=Penicillium brasilianum TaxID=104259 RepID=A0A0F7VED4_PENBI|nr:Putative Phosphotransferase [Penicillium brasilianum]
MEELEQFEQVELLRRRQLQYYYVKMTAEKNPEHYEALTYDFSALRRRLFHHASDPWEGDNMTLKADLVTLLKNWTEVNRDAKAACPISFSDDESTECLRLVRAQSEADEQFTACLEAIGAGAEGWVPVAHYDEAKRCERKLKADALDAAETEEERARIEENWIFDDFCEEDYM